MKVFIVVFLALTFVTAFAQTEEHQLCITNKVDQIYAIVAQGFADSLRANKKNTRESYDDFVFHAQTLGKKISIPVKIYISSSVTFEKKKIDIMAESPFTYLFIRKGDKWPKIYKGVDTWSSLKEQVDKYFNTAGLKLEKELQKQ
jgi:hypothetical protein